MVDSDDKVALEPVIDNLPHAIMVVNDRRIILLVNKMFTAFVNKAKREVYGIPGGKAFSCVHSADVPEGCGFGPTCQFCAIKKIVQKTFASRQDQPMSEAVMNFSDKGKRWLRFCTTYLKTENTDAAIVAVEDITDLKKQERLRVMNEKLRAAMEIGGAVCHEMNQPLQVLLGEIGLMLESSEASDPTYHKLTDMKAQLKRLSEITKKLMKLHSYHTKTYIDEIRILDLDKSSE